MVTTAGLTVCAAWTMADCSLTVTTCSVGAPDDAGLAPTAAIGAGRLRFPDMSSAAYVPADASVAATSAAVTTTASPGERVGAGRGWTGAGYGSIHWLGVAAAFHASWDHVGRGSGGGL